MSFSFKNIFMIFVFISTTNIIFNYIGTNIFDNPLLWKISYKLFLVFVCLVLLKETNLLTWLKPLKNNFVFIVISLILLVFSFLQIQGTIIQNTSDIGFRDNIIFNLSCVSVGAFEELFFRIFIFLFLLKIFENRKKQSYSYHCLNFYAFWIGSSK